MMVAASLLTYVLVIALWCHLRGMAGRRVWPWAAGTLAVAGVAGYCPAFLQGSGGFDLLSLQFDENAAFLASLAVLFAASLRERRVVRPLSIGLLCMAPLFAARNTGSAPEQEISLLSLSGQEVVFGSKRPRPVVVNLWASWCGPCVREMPMMHRIADAAPDVDFLFVNQGEEAHQIAQFLLMADLPARRVLLDPDKSLMHRYGSFGLPTTLFFDPNGELRAVQVGEVSQSALKTFIGQISPLVPQR